MNNLLCKIENLNVFFQEGGVVNTPREVINELKALYKEGLQEMVEREHPEFLEGFLAALLFQRALEIGSSLSAILAETSEDSEDPTDPEIYTEVYEAQLDTVTTLLAEHLRKRRASS